MSSTYCAACGNQLFEGALFCSNCGKKIDRFVSKSGNSSEVVLGAVLFSGYYPSICFTDMRIIQFQEFGDRWKFLLNVALKPERLVIVRNMALNDVLGFEKTQIPRREISAILLEDHGRFRRGHFRVMKTSGEYVDLARIDVDVDQNSFSELRYFVESLYDEVTKKID